MAIKDCDEALKIDPTFVRALVRKGTAYLRMKDQFKAMEAFEAALKHEPNVRNKLWFNWSSQAN